MKPRTAILALIPCLTLLNGCTMLQNALKSEPSPTVRLAGMSLADISLTQATVNFDLAVTNNYTVPLPVANVGYALSSTGQPFLTGNANLQTTIPVGQTRTLRLPATLSYAQVLTLVKGIKPGIVLPYDAHLDVSIDVPVTGRLTVPLDKSGQLPVPSVPTIELTSVKWQELSLSKATALLDIKVGNTSQYVMNLTQLSGALSLSGTQIGDVKAKTGPALNPGESGTIQLPITLSPEQLGLSAFRMLSGNGADYHMTGGLNVSTPFGPMGLPFDNSGKVGFSR